MYISCLSSHYTVAVVVAADDAVARWSFFFFFSAALWGWQGVGGYSGMVFSNKFPYFLDFQPTYTRLIRRREPAPRSTLPPKVWVGGGSGGGLPLGSFLSLLTL